MMTDDNMARLGTDLAANVSAFAPGIVRDVFALMPRLVGNVL
jgi:hypothetical protein